MIDAVDVSLVAGLVVCARERSSVGCGCAPLEVDTRTLRVCTSVVAGEIGGGAGTHGTGRAQVRDILLMLGQALGTLGGVSAVGVSVVSVVGSDSSDERLCHC